MAETKKDAVKKAPAAKKTAEKKAPAKKATSVTKKPVAKKNVTKSSTKSVKKLGKVVFEFDGQQIDYKAIEKKAAKLGGNVYVVAAEKKIFDENGNSVDLF